MTRRIRNAWLFCLGVLLCASATAQSVEVIQLDHRLAAELLPVVQPLAGEGGSVQAHQDKLIVRAAPGALADIRRIVTELDTPPRQLIVSVQQGLTVNRQTRGASAGVRGDGISIGSGGPEDSGIVITDESGRRFGAGVTDRTSRRGGQTTQQLRILEGRSGLIEIGRQSPVIQRQVLPSVLGAPVVIEQPAYESALTGFRVTPRVVGNQFELDIAPRQTLDGGRVRQVQQLNTTVTGPLGQWVDIGGAVSQQTSSESGLGRYRERQAARDGGVLVKVEVAK